MNFTASSPYDCNQVPASNICSFPRQHQMGAKREDIFIGIKPAGNVVQFLILDITTNGASKLPEIQNQHQISHFTVMHGAA